MAWGIVLILLQTLIAGAQVLIFTELEAHTWQHKVYHVLFLLVTMIIPALHFCLALEWRPKYPLFIGYYLALPVFTYLILL